MGLGVAWEGEGLVGGGVVMEPWFYIACGAEGEDAVAVPLFLVVILFLCEKMRGGFEGVAFVYRVLSFYVFNLLFCLKGFSDGVRPERFWVFEFFVVCCVVRVVVILIGRV